MTRLPFIHQPGCRCARMFRFFMAHMIILVALMAGKATAATIALPQTGQTSCWDANGTLLGSCTGTGQDGEYLAGLAWPSPRFSDNGDQTMTDNLTGLIWSKDANPAAGTKTWQQALDYIKTLNSQNYQGHNDWRLPNINELKSLVNSQQADQAVWLNGQGFVNVQSSYYWSSSANGYNSSCAWYVGMDGGGVSFNGKSYSFYVWPVRGGQPGAFGTLIISKTGQSACYDANGASRPCSATGEDGELQSGAAWPSTRFTGNSAAPDNSGTITDTLTGLMWSTDANSAAAPKTWQGALDYIKTLNSQNYQGHNDWRLPNREELASLVDWSQANQVTWLNGQGFVNAQADYYWSSSTYAYSTGYAWVVSMDIGYVYHVNKSVSSYVWPVRGGQSGAFGNLIISKAGSGSGTITPSTGAISWSGSTGSASYASGTVVTLTATPDSGSSFSGWSGCDSVSGASCTVTMSAAKNVTATFEKNWVVSLQAVSNGSISPGQAATVTNGGTASYTLTPAGGYQIASVSGCGGSLSGSTYTTGAITAGCMISATFSAIDTASGLVAWYPFNGNASDASGNGNNGTVNGATLTTDRFGNANGAYSFNGASYIELPNLAARMNAGTVTVSAWINFSGGTAHPRVFQFGDDSYGFFMFTRGTSDSRTLGFAFMGLGVEGSDPVSANQWHHVAGVSDTSSTKIYVDGNLYATITGTHSVPQLPSTFSVGRKFDGSSSNDFWGGAIDEFRVYNRALTAAEVHNLSQQAGIKLPRTGQTICYDTAGVEVACSGSGQDGEWLAGLAWPSPRFSDNGDQTVTDNLTGLQWSKDANPAAGTRTWQQALDYVKTLNSSSYLGHTGWRLPNINELRSLVNSQQGNNANWLNSQGFVNAQADYYWSSTTVSSSAGVAHDVYMDAGYRSSDDKSTSKYVWVVRTADPDIHVLAKTGQTICYETNGTVIDCNGTGQDGELQKGTAWPSPRFSEHTSLTMIDNLTGLVWSKNANPASAVTTWQGALEYIRSLNSQNWLGYNDWRLPNQNELESLSDWQQSSLSNWLNQQGFSNVTGFCWSSTSSARSPGSAAIMHVNAALDGKSNANQYVWPVRGGITSRVNDTIAPSITAFTLVSPSNAATVGITTLTVTDNIAVSHYCLTEANDSASCSWSSSKPASYTFGGLTQGVAASRTLYAFAKDGAGNISALVSAGSTITLPDSTAPAISAFSLPASVGSLTVSGITLTATDNIGVTGYCLTETNSSSGCNWQAGAPASYTFSGSYGSRTLYAFVKDAAGIISNSASAATTLIQSGLALSTPAAVALIPGESANRTLTITAVGLYNSSTTVTAAFTGNAPSGVTVGVSGQPLTPATSGSDVTISVSTTAGATVGNHTIRITASGSGDSKTVDIPLTIAAPPAITTTTLPTASKLANYSATIATSGGIGTVTCAVTAGSLPAGLSLSGCSISGMATTRGASNPFTVTASDSANHSASQALDIRVSDPNYRALVLGSDSWSVAKGEVSQLISARIVDENGVETSAAAGAQITVSSNSGTGRFSLDGLAFTSSSTFYPTISAGSTSTEFLYKDTSAGSFTLTAAGKASDPNSKTWGSGTHAITVSDAVVNDTTAPTVTAFSIPLTSGSLTVAISSLTASDNQGGSGVSDYCVMETSSSNGCSWSATPPASHVFASSGSKTLYAFARDAKGNISAPLSAPVTIAPQKVTLLVSKSEAAAGTITSEPSGISCAEVSCTDTYGQYNEGTTVTLTATPAAAYYFVSWTNCDTPGGATCTVSATAGHSPVTAVFSAKKITTLSLAPKLQTLQLNDPLTIGGTLAYTPATPGADLTGQTITLNITAPGGTSTRTATTSDINGTWSLPLDIFTARGTYLIQAVYAGGARQMAAQSDVATILVAKSAGYAIVVQGKIPGNEGIKDHQHTTDAIIANLKARSILPDNIKYLASTANSAPAKAQLQDAITTWARDKINGSAAPLYLIMIDHGGPAQFYLGAETVSPAELNTWLSTLEANLNQTALAEKRYIVIGTCYSGSFIPTLSKPGRVLITSAAGSEVSIRGTKVALDENSQPIRQGELFMEELFTHFSRGATIKTAFARAAETVRSKDARPPKNAGFTAGVYDTLNQHPLIDDNGDGVGSYEWTDNGDGSSVAAQVIGDGAVKTNASDNPADIRGTTATTMLASYQTSQLLWLAANNDSRVGSAWVEIKKPGAVTTSGSATGQAVIELETVLLTHNSAAGRWETTYTGFSDPGTWQVFYYTTDSQTGDVSPMAASTVYKATAGNNAPSGFNLISPADQALVDAVIPFSWEPASDPDGDQITYTFSIATDQNFTNEIYRRELLVEPFHVIPQFTLNDSSDYYWQVIAIDQYGGQKASTGARRFSTFFTNALPGFIKGYIVNSVTGAAISGATIGNGTGTTTSYANGAYLMPLPAGDYTLTITASGYTSATKSVTSVPGRVVSAPVAMQLNAINGVCGTSNGTTVITAPSANLCSAGAASSVTGSGPWNWSCAGSNGGTTDNCSAAVSLVVCPAVVDPVCGSNGKTYSNSCEAGVAGVAVAHAGACKPGDCDNDNTVTIAEVQSAINMFLGLKAVQACVDTSGDTSVSIAEVQKTINSFLGL